MEDEISIKDIIDFVKRYFWLSVLVGFIFVGGYTFVSLLQPAMYTASVSFLINQATVVAEGEIKKVGLSSEFYKTLLKDETFLTELALSSKEFHNISVDKLKEIKIEAKSDIINLVSKDPDPKVAKLVLEVISEGLSTQVKKMRDSQRGLSEVIQRPRDMLEKNMIALARKIETYKKEKNVDELRRDLSVYSNLISDYESKLLRLSDEIEILERNRTETESYLKKEEEKLGSEKVMSPVYQSLKSQLISLNIKLTDLKNQKEILSPKLEEVTKEANKLRMDLISIERELSDMQLEYDLLRNRYLELIKTETNVQSFGPYSLGDITFLGPVHVSDKPESRIRVKWLGVSGLCGLFVGIILGFIKEAYSKSEKAV